MSPVDQRSTGVDQTIKICAMPSVIEALWQAMIPNAGASLLAFSDRHYLEKLDLVGSKEKILASYCLVNL